LEGSLVVVHEAKQEALLDGMGIRARKLVT